MAFDTASAANNLPSPLQSGLDALAGNPSASAAPVIAAPAAPAAPGLPDAVTGQPAAPESWSAKAAGGVQKTMSDPVAASAILSQPGGLNKVILLHTINALAPESEPDPNSFGGKLKAAMSGITGSLGDAAAAGENVKPGSGWLGGVEKTMAARNTRLAAQKQQQFANANEAIKTQALVAQENAAKMHDQMLIAAGGREMQEAAATRDTAAMQPLLHPAPGAEPAQIIDKGINSDVVQRDMKPGPDGKAKYDPTTMHIYHTGNEEVPGTKDENGLPLIRATYTILGPLPPVNVPVDRAEFINKWAPHALPSGPLSTDPKALQTLPGEQYSSLYQQAASAETAFKTDALARQKADIEKYNVELSGEAASIGKDWGEALSRARGDYATALQDPTLLAKYPNAVQLVMKRQVAPDAKPEATGEPELAKILDDQAKAKQEAWQRQQEALPKTLEEATSQSVAAAQAYNAHPTPENKQKMANAEAQRVAAQVDKTNQAAAQAEADAKAEGKDQETMYRVGINPITHEHLNLDNAPDAALVNSQGQVVPGNMISLYKPTMQEKQTADTARQVLAISADLRQEVDKNPGIIGPLMGRDIKAMAKLGYGQQDTQKLLNDIGFLQSAATKMHTGRFSKEILEKMSSMVDAHMNPSQFKGGLDSINDVAGRYAQEDTLRTVGEVKADQEKYGKPEAPTMKDVAPPNAVGHKTVNGITIYQLKSGAVVNIQGQPVNPDTGQRTDQRK